MPQASLTENSALARKAMLGLALANLGWGWSFVAMKLCPGHILELAPNARELSVMALFVVWRFLLAALCYAALTFPHQKNYTRGELLGGLSTGAFFVTGLLAQMSGLRYTLPSISGFLTALVVLFLPITQAFILRRPPPLRTWPAVALALAGVVVLSLPQEAGEAQHGPFPYFGEVLSIAGSLCFTGQVLCLDHFGKTAHASRLTFIQFVTTALLALVLFTVLPGGSELRQSDTVQALVSNRLILWYVASTALFSTVFAYHLMSVNQPKLTPATAGVIYCLEPLCATGYSILLGLEDLRGSLVCGGVLVLAGILIVVRGQDRAPESPVSTG